MRRHHEIIDACGSLARQLSSMLRCGVWIELADAEGEGLKRTAIHFTDQVPRLALLTLTDDGRRAMNDAIVRAAAKHDVFLRCRPDAEVVPGLTVVRDAHVSLQFQPVAVAAIRDDGALLGLVFCVRDRESPPFTVHDLALLSRVVATAGAGIARAAQAGAPHQVSPSEPLMRMNAVATALNDATSVRAVVQVLLDLGSRAVLATGMSLFRAVSAETLELIARNDIDLAFGGEGDTLAIRGHHPFARAARLREALWFRSAEALLRVLPLDVDVARKSTPMAILPLHLEERLLGLMVLRFASSDLDVQDRGTLRILARLATYAFDRAEMFEAERRATRRLERLAVATSSFAASTDLEPTLNAIVDAFVPDVAAGIEIELGRDLGGEQRAQGVLSGTHVRDLAFVVRGEKLGRARLHGLTSDDSSETTLFATELARRASLALDAVRTMRRLHGAIAAREDFLAVAGHELRTPLTALKMCLFELGLDGVKAEMAERQVERLELIVKQILDVTKLAHGGLDLDIEDVDLSALVRDVSASFAHQVRTAGSPLELHADAPVHGRWDRHRLAQVISNLIGNALKYGRGKPIEIEVASPDDDTVRVRVVDQGIGIAPEALGRIFERFERAVSSREYAGMGVGLWVARQIVEAHGGDIEVASKLGVGTEFIVELPRRADAHQSEVA